jgi:hypothetical protein
MPRISTLGLTAGPARIEATTAKVFWIPPVPPPPPVVEVVPMVRAGFFPEIAPPFVRNIEPVGVQLQGFWYAVARDRLVAAEPARALLDAGFVVALPVIERVTRHHESIVIGLDSLVAGQVQERCILSAREYYVLSQVKIVLSSQPLDRHVVHERRERVMAHLWRMLEED